MAGDNLVRRAAQRPASHSDGSGRAELLAVATARVVR